MTRRATEAERLFRGNLDLDSGGIEAGTVGWDDGGEHYDEEEGEPTLVKVTLFRGRNPDTEPGQKTTRAQGMRILARVGQPLNYIPLRDTEVMVAIPAGFSRVPGMAVVFTAVGVAPAIQSGPARMKLDLGPDVDVFIKGRSVTISDYEDRYITVGPDYGIKIGDGVSGANLKDDKWTFYATDASDGDCKGVLEIAKELVRVQAKKLDGSQISGFIADGQTGDFQVTGTRFVSLTDGGVLGKTAIATNKITYNVSLVSTRWSIDI